MIFKLDGTDTPCFPNPIYGEPDGLLAIGGKLTPDWLTLAYDNGIFPWFAFEWHDEPEWYCPMERFVIFPEEIHISHSMRNMINHDEYDITFDKAFDRVIEHCSKLRIDMEGAWLGPEMVDAYKELHRLNRAASVEVWHEGELAGGLYGVVAGRAFCGESMFSLRPGASKLALIALARRLSNTPGGPYIIDCQFETPHLKSMGGRKIPYSEYMEYLVDEEDD